MDEDSSSSASAGVDKGEFCVGRRKRMCEKLGNPRIVQPAEKDIGNRKSGHHSTRKVRSRASFYTNGEKHKFPLSSKLAGTVTLSSFTFTSRTFLSIASSHLQVKSFAISLRTSSSHPPTCTSVLNS